MKTEIKLNNQRIIWTAIGEIDDNLSRMGGANWPKGMRDSEIVSYVILKLLNKCYPHIDFDIFLYCDFRKNDRLKDLFNSVDKILSKTEVDKGLLETINDCYEYYDKKMKPQMKSGAWFELKDILEKGDFTCCQHCLVLSVNLDNKYYTTSLHDGVRKLEE